MVIGTTEIIGIILASIVWIISLIITLKLKGK